MQASKRGWGSPGLNHRAHYFDNDTISVCRRWRLTGELNDSRDDHIDNCASCRKIKQRRDNPKPRGLAAMTPEEQHRITSLGGKAAHEQGKAHEFTRDEARKAGRKGGLARQQARRLR